MWHCHSISLLIYRYILRDYLHLTCEIYLKQRNKAESRLVVLLCGCILFMGVAWPMSQVQTPVSQNLSEIRIAVLCNLKKSNPGILIVEIITKMGLKLIFGYNHWQISITWHVSEHFIGWTHFQFGMFKVVVKSFTENVQMFKLVKMQFGEFCFTEYIRRKVCLFCT